MPMNSRVLLVSTYAELTGTARKIAAELNLPMVIKEGGIMSDGHLYAKEVENQFDVIISQGGTVTAIRNLVKSTPVLAVNIATTDYLKALNQAVQYGKPLALISYASDEVVELQELSSLLRDVKYEVYIYHNKQEFGEQIAKVLQLPARTIVGLGSCIQWVAKKKNIRCAIVKSTEKAIRSALTAAKNILELSKKEKLHTQRLESILNYSNTGVVSIADNGSITIINTMAEKLLGISAEKVKNMKYADTAAASDLKTLYGNSGFAVNELVEIQQTMLYVNRIPLRIAANYDETLLIFWEVASIRKLEHKVRLQLSAQGLTAKIHFEDILHTSETMKNVIRQAKIFSKTDATILIQGKTGTGKELFAQSIHNASPRQAEPFVAVNCAALPENLLESELFGYESGAFTGAKKGGKIGLFELAHNGTIFLDEISEISPALQSRLLRVLQEREILRVGGDRIIKIDVRVVAATNKDLYQLVQNGMFREDLYFRVHVLKLTIPPLCRRKDDIPVLIAHFLEEKSKKYGFPSPSLAKKGLDLLIQYVWSGNVRELEYFIEKLILLTDGPTLNEHSVRAMLSEHTYDHLPEAHAQISDSLKINIASLKNMELQIIEQLLKRHNGNRTCVSEILGISRVTIWNKLNQIT